MTKSKTNPRVDFYFKKAGRWQQEFEMLRTIILDTGLNEELKWGCPCYTFGTHLPKQQRRQEANIVLIHGFKDYCALLFFKGALLKDPKGLLIQQTENVQSARQIRFTNLPEIVKMEGMLKSYIHEAIEVEKKGLKVDLKKTSDFKMPLEFQKRLKQSAALKTAFKALTPGRQRAYLFYFSQPKLSGTREARVEKSIQQILAGKGLDD